jgi:dTDP-glucose 4,6-dehydratase
MLNLLVTGGCGFIGSNFINCMFPKKKYKIINVDCINYCSNEENVNILIRNDPNYFFYKTNINNTVKMSQIITHHNIDIVIHFAAQSHVQNSFEDSLLFTQDNILGTHNLIETCRKYGKLKKFIHVSTDEVYGESHLGEKEPKKNESSILSPTNPYAATKAAAEMIVKSYYKSFNVPVIITRGNNVYGYNQYPEKLIPRFIKLLLNNEPVTIQGNGNAVRGFLHSFDTANAFETIIDKGIIGEIYNIGCDDCDEYTVLEISNILIKLIHGENINTNDYIKYIEDRPFNDQRYYISNKKIRELGWLPKINFLQGIKLLIEHEKMKNN